MLQQVPLCFRDGAAIGSDVVIPTIMVLIVADIMQIQTTLTSAQKVETFSDDLSRLGCTQFCYADGIIRRVGSGLVKSLHGNRGQVACINIRWQSSACTGLKILYPASPWSYSYTSPCRFKIPCYL